MRLGVNALTLKPGHCAGEELYLRHVLRKIRELQPSIELIVYTDSENHDSFEEFARLPVGEGGVKSIEIGVRDSKVDLLFTPLRTAPLRALVPFVPFALELDTGPPRRWGQSSALKTLRQTCHNAFKLIVPSQFLRRQFLETLEIPLEKVVVAPLGVEPVFGEPQPCFLQKPYLLTVGSTRPSKNIPALRQVFERIAAEFPHTLAVVGRPGEDEPADWGPRVLRFEYLPDQHLASLYQHCDAFFSATTHEGSGVTALEAMRAGAPVVTSRVGGIPEAAGQTPIYHNHESVQSMTAAVRRVLQDGKDALRKQIRAGQKTAAEYTWEKCVWKTLQAFTRG